MAKLTKGAEIAALRRQLRDPDARRASVEAELSALTSEPTSNATSAPTPENALGRARCDTSQW
jgi:hypothetical protein